MEKEAREAASKAKKTLPKTGWVKTSIKHPGKLFNKRRKNTERLQTQQIMLKHDAAKAAKTAKAAKAAAKKAVKKGKVGKRVGRRVAGKATGKAMRKLFK